MISWILGVILIIWIIIMRFSKEGKIEGEPLSLPRGTIRALITLLIVSFPLNNLIQGKEIPPIIINAIFILVAFYFEARKGIKEELKKIIKDIKSPEKLELERKTQKYPLYLPKYSVRITLIIILAFTLVYNLLGPNVPFVTTNTLQDILIIIVLFIIGAIFRAIGIALKKGKLKEEIENINGNKSLSTEDIIEKLSQKEARKWKTIGKSLISIILLVAILIALMLYTLDIIILVIPFINISLRDTLLLLINVYYGFRD